MLLLRVVSLRQPSFTFLLPSQNESIFFMRLFHLVFKLFFWFFFSCRFIYSIMKKKEGHHLKEKSGLFNIEAFAENLSTVSIVGYDLLQAFNFSFDEVWITDGEGNTLSVGSSFETNYGVENGFFIGKNAIDLERQGYYSPSTVRCVLEEKRSVIQVQTTNFNRRLIVVANPLFDESGKITRVISFAKDVSDQEQLLARLNETEKLLDVYREQLNRINQMDFKEETLVVKSLAMVNVLNNSKRVAKVDANVLLQGESGVGKSIIANYIHSRSRRKNEVFVTVDCGAIPPTLIESELFGYEGGSFTGAKKDGKRGLLEMADGGTVLLDEIGELPLNMQVKLLHFIQDKTLLRIGGEVPIRVDARIIAATNRNLLNMVENGEFREDLYYRLNVVPLHIPALRERAEDIPPLIEYFVGKFNNKYCLKKRLNQDSMSVLGKYPWPGNVRELENLIERLLVTVDDVVIGEDLLPDYLKETPIATMGSVIVYDLMPMQEAVEETERQILQRALGKYSNTYAIGKALGINQSTVVRKMQRYGLTIKKQGGDKDEQ